jgi:hypothetical protein
MNDVQAKAKPWHPPDVRTALVRLQESRPVFCGKARSLVSDNDASQRGVAGHLDVNLTRTAKLHGVADKITDDLFNPTGRPHAVYGDR